MTMRKIICMLAAAVLPLAATAGRKTAEKPQEPLRLWYQQPATYFEESLPLGNGKLGALVYGNPTDDIVHLNDITLWTGKPVDQQEDAGASQWIPRIREALFSEDYALADSLQRHVQGHNSQFYQPLATLHIADGDARQPEGYRRELDLDSALAHITYIKGGTTFAREYFASHPDKAVAIRLTSDHAGKLDQRLTLTSQVPHSVRASLPGGAGWQGQLTLTGHATGDPQESIHFCAHLLVRLHDGHVELTDTTLHIVGATEAELYFVNETSFNGARSHPVSQGAPYVEQAADDAWHLLDLSYAELRRRHVADYREHFARVSLQLGKDEHHATSGRAGATAHDGPSQELPTDRLLLAYADGKSSRQLETLFFQYGRYLLISCSRTPGVPANLQGLWTPHKWSPWRGNYTMNINLEENYWPAFVANLAETAAPLDDFVGALAENGRHTARHYYGIERGWCASHNSDLWAMTNPVGEKNEMPEWANWNMGGAWLVNTLWERYLFTQDRDYLQRVAWPLMRGATEFCLQWLIPNPKHPGELITAPSTSPENEYVNDQGYHGQTCYGGTADLAIIRELLTNTARAYDVVSPLNKGADDGADSLPERIRRTLEQLHPYTVGRQGDLNEWYYDWADYDPQHRHQSHLIGLYPGNHLTDGALREACEQTLRQKGDYTTGWSTGWRINLWARLHRGNDAYRILQKLLTYVSPDGYEGPDRRRSGGTYPNLFDAHPPFQIDGNFGGTAGMCEMLLQSTSGPHDAGGNVVELLPALPDAWPDGHVSGLCARGGFEVEMTWRNGRIVEAYVGSRTGGKATVCYNGRRKQLNLKAGARKRLH